MLLTEEMVQITLFDFHQPKLLGRKKPPEKSNSEPMSSRKFRIATTESMRASVNRSTMSTHENQQPRHPRDQTLLASAGDLEKIVLFKLLEHTTFDFDELIGDQERQQGVVIGVHGYV